ncbi:hypothetical protein DF3PB_3500001 [uncultured Defluviicoccus sp.]|uniref:Uncharacterized protein n=1 Tax=metagenome TaxID=256318 RepID=A0A380TH16_9ZZZZ|nr:hypothetical protein DF3PB_3500001 [uncultured Defluviicoccus sp.]
MIDQALYHIDIYGGFSERQKILKFY